MDRRLGPRVVVIRAKNQEGLRCFGQQLCSTGVNSAKVAPEFKLRKGSIALHPEGHGDPKALAPLFKSSAVASGEPDQAALVSSKRGTGHRKEPSLSGEAPHYRLEPRQQTLLASRLVNGAARVQRGTGAQESVVQLISGATRLDQLGGPAKVTFCFLHLAPARVPEREECCQMPLGALDLALQAAGQHCLNGGKRAADAVEVRQHNSA